MFFRRSAHDPLVSFACVGAQKAGTTALDQILRQHPLLSLPSVKETHFFSQPRFRPSRKAYRLYEAFFSPTPGQICGEITPAYMYWRESMGRLKDYNPEMRIIMILRNPIERAHSQWAMERSRGLEDLSFGDAIRAEKDRLAASPHGQDQRYSYCTRGLYTGQVERARHYFGKEQVLLINYDDYDADPRRVIGSILSFLGLHKDDKIGPVRAFASGRKAMDPDDKAYLVDFFADDVKKLEGMTGWPLKAWLH